MAGKPQVVLATEAGGLKPSHTGKVRDIYDRGDRLVIVTTDRISAFDVVMKQGVPFKGQVLHGITKYWMENLGVPNHYITDDLTEIGQPFSDHPEVFAGRSMLVKKMKPLPVECIVRAYLTGSCWGEYKRSNRACGYQLPSGMQENQPFFMPIFTPSTKAAQGQHDQNISCEQMTELLGGDKDLSARLINESLRIFQKAGSLLWDRSIILADTKFEWGLSGTKDDNTLYLIDEAFTPDSSRFWPFHLYRLGEAIHSADKQILRDWLTNSGWNKQGEPPDLSASVINHLELTYLNMYETITGKELE
jgi:phosphoribosylaminoimidazole-succinocarboxamide synthase